MGETERLKEEAWAEFIRDVPGRYSKYDRIMFGAGFAYGRSKELTRCTEIVTGRAENADTRKP